LKICPTKSQLQTKSHFTPAFNVDKSSFTPMHPAITSSDKILLDVDEEHLQGPIKKKLKKLKEKRRSKQRTRQKETCQKERLTLCHHHLHRLFKRVHQFLR